MTLVLPLTHPDWCSRHHCTAFVDEDIVYRRHHRTEPLVISSDDPTVSWYTHMGAEPDGSDPYLEIVGVEGSMLKPWWHLDDEETRSMVNISLEDARRLCHFVETWRTATR